MAMYSTNRARPMNRAGQDSTTRDRGMSDYFTAPRNPNKATVSGARLVMMRNAEGQHSRRAPKVDILR